MAAKASTTERIRAVIYARFSCDKQRDASIDDQVQACTEYCERRGYEVVGVYPDYAISGRSDDRPQFLRMMKDARRGSFDVVVVWKIDRFARNMMDQYHYEREMRQSGVVLESCKENIAGNTMEADMNKGMLALFAQIRSQQSTVDTMRGMLGKAEKCQYLGIPRFGYSHEGDVITLDPVWAPVAKRLHADYLAGVSIEQLAAQLDAMGATTSRGTRPDYEFVLGILHNMAYAGVYIWGRKRDERGRVVTDAEGNPVPLVYKEGGGHAGHRFHEHEARVPPPHRPAQALRRPRRLPAVGQARVRGHREPHARRDGARPHGQVVLLLRGQSGRHSRQRASGRD